MKIIKATDRKRLEWIGKLYLDAFPEIERKPFELLVKLQDEEKMHLLCLEDENGFLGLAILAFDKDLVLLDYFAVSPKFRGQGVGSRAIRALLKIYAGKRFVLEIETTKIHSGEMNDNVLPEELLIRQKRKAFYLNNGLHTMDFDINLFGTEMEVLANCEKLTFEEYLEIYTNTCGREYSDKIYLIENAQSENICEVEDKDDLSTEKEDISALRTLKASFIDTLPVMAGYLVLGIGFGILLKEAGYGIFWSFLMSLTIYAGSMQYVAVSLITGGASLISAALTTLMVNARHLFYGVSMIDRYQDAGKEKAYLIFSLTDETYSLLCKGEYPKGVDVKSYRFYVSLLNQCYWVLGSVLGSIFGTVISFNTAGIDFSMTALFVTVFVEQWLSTKNHIPAIGGLLCSAICLIIFGPESFLIPSMIAITLFLSFGKRFISSKGGSHE